MEEHQTSRNNMVIAFLAFRHAKQMDYSYHISDISILLHSHELYIYIQRLAWISGQVPHLGSKLYLLNSPLGVKPPKPTNPISLWRPCFSPQWSPQPHENPDRPSLRLHHRLRVGLTSPDVALEAAVADHRKEDHARNHAA